MISNKCPTILICVNQEGRSLMEIDECFFSDKTEQNQEKGKTNASC